MRKMLEKDIAELATRIVITAIQSGGLLASTPEAVCTYYSAIYEQIVECDDKLNYSHKNSCASTVLS